MNQHYEFHVRVRVAPDGTSFKSAFGPGTAILLRGVEKTGSLNQAAKLIGMAYSKAWKSIKNTEAQLGFFLIERHGPRGSVLSSKGKQFLNMYDEMERVAHKAVLEVLQANGYNV